MTVFKSNKLTNLIKVQILQEPTTFLYCLLTYLSHQMCFSSYRATLMVTLLCCFKYTLFVTLLYQILAITPRLRLSERRHVGGGTRSVGRYIRCIFYYLLQWLQYDRPYCVH